MVKVNVFVKLCVCSLVLYTCVVPYVQASGFSFIGPIVTCGNDVRTVPGTDPSVGGGHDPDEVCTVGGCTVCDMVATAKRVIDFVFTVGMAIAALLLVNAGVLYVTAGGAPAAVSKAHRIFFNTLIGLIITLASWLLIDTVMKAVYNDSQWGPWNELLCSAGNSSGVVCVKKRDPLPTAPPLQLVTIQNQLGATVVLDSTTGTVVGVQGQPTGTGATPITLKNSNQIVPSGVDSQLMTTSQYLYDLSEGNSGSIVVTEGYPPSRVHGDSCHASGTCIDMTWNGQDKYMVSIAARAAGGQAVYETNNIMEYNELKEQYEIVGLTVAPPGSCTGSIPTATLCYLPSCNGSNNGKCVTGPHISYYSIPKF